MLLERIPAVPDLQAAWLILLFCASPRANFLLRALPPEATREFARQHDESLRMCLSELLGVTVDAWDIASLPLARGGVGLVSAHRGRHAASGAAGVSHDNPKAQTCTFEGPGASNTTKIPRKDQKRGKKE